MWDLLWLGLSAALFASALLLVRGCAALQKVK